MTILPKNIQRVALKRTTLVKGMVVLLLRQQKGFMKLKLLLGPVSYCLSFTFGRILYIGLYLLCRMRLLGF